MIPTRSSNPTAYLPRFSPLCAPDKALNPITAALIFHFPSFTSIQCAVIPRNPAFVVSADHPSAVIDTFPGAAYRGYITVLVYTTLQGLEERNFLQLSLLLVISCV